MSRTLKDEILAYNKMLEDDLELEHFGKWVIVHEGELKGVFETDQEASIYAVKNFKDDVYLIAQVGETESQIKRGLPAVLGAISPAANLEGAQCQ